MKILGSCIYKEQLVQVAYNSLKHFLYFLVDGKVVDSYNNFLNPTQGQIDWCLSTICKHI
jgi:hypothetical protein